MPDAPEVSALDESSPLLITANLKQPSNNADEALRAVGSDGEMLEVDEVTNKRLLKKIDLHLLPV
jgi:ACS family allantoate permease-like MFS transporter